MTEILDPNARFEVLAGIVQLHDLRDANGNGVLFTEHAAYASGLVHALELDDDELTLILREIVGLGHAILQDGAYLPTDAGRTALAAWLTARASGHAEVAAS